MQRGLLGSLFSFLRWRHLQSSSADWWMPGHRRWRSQDAGPFHQHRDFACCPLTPPPYSLATTNLFAISIIFSHNFVISRMLRMESHILSSFGTGFFHSWYLSGDSDRLLYLTIVHSSSLLSGISWCGYTTVCVTTHHGRTVGLFPVFVYEK